MLISEDLWRQHQLLSVLAVELSQSNISQRRSGATGAQTPIPRVLSKGLSHRRKQFHLIDWLIEIDWLIDFVLRDIDNITAI